MKKRLSLIIVLFCLNILVAQEEINFEHKAIYKEIGKLLDFDQFQLLALVGSDTSSVQGQYFAITNNSVQFAYAYVGRVNSCRSGGCSVSFEESSNTTFEYFDYLILYSNDIEILSVKVFNYQATHGHEVCSRGWLKQFKGYNGLDQLEVGKDIDGISGATVSVYSLTFDIEKVSTRLKENLASWNKNIELQKQIILEEGV